MPGAASIHVLDAEYGVHPRILSLNSSLRPGTPALKLALRIDWEPDEPIPQLTFLEEKLPIVFPGLRRHQCRGPSEYHLSRLVRGMAPDVPPLGAAVEFTLALAHLIEHVMIDTISFVTRAPIISGVTGALKDFRNRFDVFVECPDPAVAPLAVNVGLRWVTALLRGETPPDAGLPTLEIARHLYDRRPRALDVTSVARELKRRREEIVETLGGLSEASFVCRAAYTVNFSGIDRYRVCSNGKLQGRAHPPRAGEPGK